MAATFDDLVFRWMQTTTAIPVAEKLRLVDESIAAVNRQAVLNKATGTVCTPGKSASTARSATGAAADSNEALHSRLVGYREALFRERLSSTGTPQRVTDANATFLSGANGNGNGHSNDDGESEGGYAPNALDQTLGAADVSSAHHDESHATAPTVEASPAREEHAADGSNGDAPKSAPAAGAETSVADATVPAAAADGDAAVGGATDDGSA